MFTLRIFSPPCLVLTVIVCATVTSGFGPSVHAQEPSDATIRAGRRIFVQKADCQACHGWAGDGRKLDSQMPDGANLRESTLVRAQLIFVIKCGLPG